MNFLYGHRTTLCKRSITAQPYRFRTPRDTAIQRCLSETSADRACANVVVICCQRPVSRHMTKRLQIAEWLPYSRGMQGHGRPVRMRQRIPLMHARVVRALSSWPHNAFGIKSCIMRHSISSKSCSRIRSHFRFKPQSHAPARTSAPPKLSASASIADAERLPQLASSFGIIDFGRYPLLASNDPNRPVLVRSYQAKCVESGPGSRIRRC
jgi:hypothetical protein